MSQIFVNAIKIKNQDTGIYMIFVIGWFHPQYVDLPAAHYKIFLNKDYIWLCKNCKQGCRRKISFGNWEQSSNWRKSNTKNWCVSGEQSIQAKKGEAEEVISTSKVLDSIRMKVKEMNDVKEKILRKKEE